MTPALLVAIVLSFTPPAPAGQTCTLPGLWLGADRNKDAVGMWLEFAEDGSVVRANGRIVDGKWEIKDSALILESRGPMIQRVAFKIEGDVMTRTAEAAVWEVPKELVNTRRGTREANPDVSRMQQPVPAITNLEQHSLSRVTPAQQNQPAIVGIWGYKNKAGRPVLERFTPSRRFASLEPVVAQRGAYKVASNKLAVTADDATTEVPIVCGRNSFELDVNGMKLKFEKFQ